MIRTPIRVPKKKQNNNNNNNNTQQDLRHATAMSGVNGAEYQGERICVRVSK
jgi:hypothetical protein